MREDKNVIKKIFHDLINKYIAFSHKIGGQEHKTKRHSQIKELSRGSKLECV